MTVEMLSYLWQFFKLKIILKRGTKSNRSNQIKKYKNQINKQIHKLSSKIK